MWFIPITLVAYGNYLSPSVIKSGMDPDNLPEADKTKMNFNLVAMQQKKFGKILKVVAKGLVQLKTHQQLLIWWRI